KAIQRWRSSPVAPKSGRMRLIRNGLVLTYLIAGEGDADFTVIDEAPLTDEDLKTISFIAQTGSPKAAFDVRFLDVRIRADEFTGLSETATAEGATPGGEKKGWRGAVALIAVLVIAGAALGVVLYRRRRSPTALPTAVPGNGSPARAASAQVSF